MEERKRSIEAIEQERELTTVEKRYLAKIDEWLDAREDRRPDWQKQ
jgi:hypothetical protein